MRLSIKVSMCMPALVMAAAAHAASDTAPPAAAALTPENNICETRADPVAVGSAQWNGWGRDLNNTRYQPEPAIRVVDVPKLALKWAYGYQSAGELRPPPEGGRHIFSPQLMGRDLRAGSKTGLHLLAQGGPRRKPHR